VAPLIEGIPNQMLRNQDRIQCFGDIENIKRAFAEVKLPKICRYSRQEGGIGKEEQQRVQEAKERKRS